jgi:hypothetical protein
MNIFQRWPLMAGLVITASLLVGRPSAAGIIVQAGNATISPGGSGYVDVRVSLTGGSSGLIDAYTVGLSLPDSRGVRFPWNPAAAGGDGDLDARYPLQPTAQGSLFTTFDAVTTIGSSETGLGVNGTGSSTALFDGAGLFRVPILVEGSAAAGVVSLGVLSVQLSLAGTPLANVSLAPGLITVVPEPASIVPALIACCGLLLRPGRLNGRRR